MKKTFRSVLTLLLVVMMVFGVVAPVVSYASESELFEASSPEALTSATDSDSSESSSIIDDGWLKIDRVDNHITVTLYPDINSAMELDKAQVKEIILEILGLAKDLVIDVMREDILNGQYGNDQGGFDSFEYLWTTAFSGYCSSAGIAGEGDEVYIEFFKSSLEDETVIDGLVDYACDMILTAVKAGIISADDVAAVSASDLEEAVDAALSDAMATILGEMLTDNVAEYLNYIFDKTSDGSAVNADVLAFANAELAKHAYSIAYSVYNTNTPDTTSALSTALSAYVLAAKAEGKALADIITRANAVDILRDSLSGRDETVADEIEALINGEDISAEYTDKVYTAVLGVDKAGFDVAIASYKADMVAGFNETVDYLTGGSIDTDIGIFDIVKLVNYIAIDGHAVFEDGKIVPAGLKALILEFPNFYEISKMSDDEMQLSYDFAIGTKYGTCEFGVTAKLGGGYDEVRAIAGVISRNIDIAILPDGTIDLDIRVPEKFAQLVLRAAESGQFSDDLKQKVFAAFMLDGNDLYDNYQRLDFEDIIRILESINFEGLLDKEFIKQYVDLTGLTNEQIVNKVKQYEKYFNIAKKYVDKVVNFAVNRIPDRYMDNDILSVFDHVDSNDVFYYENGNFGYEGTHTLSYDYILKAINKVADKLDNYISLEKYGITNLGALVTAFVPQYYIDNGFTLSVDIDVELRGINRVDYVVDGTVTRYGLLPVGADVHFYSGCTRTDLLYWVDQYGNVVSEMPDYDVVLTAVFNDGVVRPLKANISAEYGEQHTVGVVVGLADTAGITYEWAKDGTPLAVTASHFTVADVADSGTYTCVVYKDGLEFGTASITVSITPAVIDVSDIALESDLFDADGAEHTVAVDASTVPAHVLYTVASASTVSATDIGTYYVTLELASDSTNYVLSSDTLTLEWSIRKVIDASEFEWQLLNSSGFNQLYNSPVVVYSGSVYTASLILGEYADVLEVSYEHASASAVGVYKAKVTGIDVLDSSYAVINVDKIPVLQWTIAGQHIDIEGKLEWVVDDLVYNGSEQGITLAVKDGVDPEIKNLIETYVKINLTNASATNAGSYTASASFELNTAAEGYDHFIIIGADTILDQSWSIAKKVIDVSALTWTDSSEFVYDGSEKTVVITDADTSLVELEYFGNTAVNAGDYTAEVWFTLVDEDNYELSADTLTHEWSIAKKVIKVTAITWNDTLNYNGSDLSVSYTLTLDDSALAEYITAVLSTETGYTNTAKDVNTEGNYVAYIAIVSNDSNYSVDTSAVADLLEHEWNITPKTIDLSALTWNYTAPFVYSGSEYSVALSDETGLSVVYTGEKATDADTYVATAIATPINGNYTVTGEIADCTWIIDKQTVDVSSIQFNDSRVEYDGTAHSLAVEGDADVLALFDIVYTGNGNTLIGKYTVSVTLTLKSDCTNYTATPLTLDAELEIWGEKKVSHDVMNGTIKIEVSGGVDADQIATGTIYTGAASTYELPSGETVEVLVAYDIFFKEGDSVVTFDGKTFTVKMLIPADYRDLKDDELKIIHITNNGVEDMNATRDGDYLVFTTTHFSVYAIVKVQGPSYLWLWILLAVNVLLAIAIAVYYIISKKKNNETPAPDTIPTVEPKSCDDTDAVAPVEEIAEEEPVDEVEEEPVAEDVPEIVEDETPEVVEDETPEIVEDEAPVEEEPVEEEPIEEEPVEEEPVEEAPIEEAPAEEEPAIAEPVVVDQSAVLSLADDKATKATAVIGGQTVLIRFRRSFMSRLIQSSDKIQGYYTAIKNQLLSYKGVKVRSSWNYEAFNKGRVQCAKLNIKGKTLIVNLNLDPAEYNINKYHFLDMSAKPKYAKVPMMMKVRSDRALKYTLELIDEMMKALGVPQREIPTEDYRMPYETTESLARRGLVKVILPAGVTLSDDMNVVQMNVTEFIESENANNEKTVEQIIITEPVEEAPVEEAPVEEAPVEEAPVEEAPVEEAPVEEAPVEETPVEEAPVEEAPIEEAPVEEAPIEEAPIEEAPVEEAPIEEAPVEEAPIEEAPVEEAPIEEAPVEETPVEEALIEEAPVEETPVEEAPVEEAPVEEAPVEEAPVEEAPVEEAPIEEAPVAEEASNDVHVDAVTADELLTDEEAEAHIEVIHTGASKRQGKMGEINLDLICENFEDGDTVDVEALKAKRLVSNKVAKVKILARGIMTKKLTVVASKFSLQAVKMITLAGGKAEIED